MESPIRIVGLIIPDLMDTHYAEVAKGVERILRPQGYTVLLSNSSGDAEAERQVADLLLTCSQVVGLMIASAQEAENVSLFRRIERHKLPYVLIDRNFPGLDANFVGTNDEEIGAAATEHLISRGCRHIAHIRGSENSTGLGRWKGYAEVLARRGLRSSPGYVVDAGSTDESGYEAMERLLSVNPRLDGVVCFNDAVAVGAIKRILEAGLEVPYDIEVVGAGNLHYSDILRVPLSTIDLNSALAGERAAELLLRSFSGGEDHAPERVLVPFGLIARESSKTVTV
jgi:LacI family transcriptional regulator